MRSRIFNTARGLVGASLAMASFFASAATVDILLTQAPKSPLTNNPTPPTLSASNLAAYNLFRNGITILGGNEFEGGSGPAFGASAGTASFTYTGGAATATGITNANVVGQNQSQPNLGRYNMTTGVATDPNTLVASGHWLETTSTFSYTFAGTTAISAFSVFMTDVGDLGGTLSVDVYTNNGTTLVKHKDITNALADSAGRTNGNLTFYGISSDVTTFDKITFTLTGGGATDVVGFDSIMVGRLQNVPEPASLALVGVALAGLGVVSAQRRKA